MDFTTIDNINKEMLIANVGKMYRDSKQIASESVLCIKEEEGVYSCLKVKDKIDRILQDMRLEYAYIIQKDFLEVSDEKWYVPFFSEEEYKLYRKGAVDSFLHQLYG